MPEQQPTATLEPGIPPSVYTLNAAYLDVVWEQQRRLARRARRIGVEPLTVEIVREYTTADDDGRVTRHADVRMVGQPPAVAGSRLLAKLEWVDEAGRNLVWPVPGHEDHPALDEFVTRRPVCDHCQTARPRRITFAVATAEGKLVQVGRQCLADYLGLHRDPVALARWFEWLAQLAKTLKASDRDDGDSLASGGGAWMLPTVLAEAAAAIRLFGGYISRSAAEDLRRPSTGMLVADSLTARDRRERLPVSDADRALADKAVRWAGTLQPTGDYQENLITLLHAGFVTFRQVGLAASMVMAYQRAAERAKALEQQLRSRHVGTVKQRRTFTLTVQTSRTVGDPDSRYGLRHLLIFTDTDGNVLKWVSSRILCRRDSQGRWIPGDLVDEGDVLTVKATIKAHETYRHGQRRWHTAEQLAELGPGVAQTVLTRGNVLDIAEGAAQPQPIDGSSASPARRPRARRQSFWSTARRRRPV